LTQFNFFRSELGKIENLQKEYSVELTKKAHNYLLQVFVQNSKENGDCFGMTLKAD